MRMLLDRLGVATGLSEFAFLSSRGQEQGSHLVRSTATGKELCYCVAAEGDPCRLVDRHHNGKSR